jgi:hypothetical protein
METEVFNTRNKYWTYCQADVILSVNFLQEKKRAREEKLKAEDKYMWALVDGVKEKVDECICIGFVHTFVVDQWYACLVCSGCRRPCHYLPCWPLYATWVLFLQAQAKLR